MYVLGLYLHKLMSMVFFLWHHAFQMLAFVKHSGTDMKLMRVSWILRILISNRLCTVWRWWVALVPDSYVNCPINYEFFCQIKGAPDLLLRLHSSWCGGLRVCLQMSCYCFILQPRWIWSSRPQISRISQGTLVDELQELVRLLGCRASQQLRQSRGLKVGKV